MQEPYRSDWEMSFFKEQLVQLESNSFDFVPTRICRHAMTHNIRKNVIVYKEKLLPNVNGQSRLDKTKTREAFFGTQQKVGIDVIPGSSPTLDQDTARFLLAYMRSHGLASCKFDCPMAYLRAPLEAAETMIAYSGDSRSKYSNNKDEFTYCDTDGNVYVRYYRTAVYGGKSSAYLWYNTIKIFLVYELGFADSLIVNGLFMYLTDDGEAIILGLFVDDGICLYNSAPLMHWFARRMVARFGTNFFGAVDSFLGQDITMNEQDDTTTITMQSYLEQSDEEYKLSSYNRVSVPIDSVLEVLEESTDKFSSAFHAQLGTYAWAVNNAYPSHAYALNQLQQVMHAPTKQHHVQLGRAHACLYQMRKAGIIFHGPRSSFWNDQVEIARSDTGQQCKTVSSKTSTANTKPSAITNQRSPPTPASLMQTIITQDANFGGNGEKEKPQIAEYQMICGAAWQWKSCKSAIYCDSTSESELQAAHLASQAAIATQKLCEELRIPVTRTICYGDNQAALKICHREHSSRKERGMRTRADHIKGTVQDGLITLNDIASAFNPSDIGTKAIVALDVWRYLATILHGKIRLGLPRSDFSSKDLRTLLETDGFHSSPAQPTSRPASHRNFGNEARPVSASRR